jgi:hypothetical protein
VVNGEYTNSKLSNQLHLYTNPSLTYMAFAARAVDYAVGQMKKGEI